MTRIAIAGVPSAGKTTLAAELGADVTVRHTDDLVKSHEWSAASAEVATWFDAPGPWIIEGVAVPRALRKWLAAHPTGLPCGEVIWLPTPRLPLSRGQETMAKGCVTVWREIAGELARRGVLIR